MGSGDAMTTTPRLCALIAAHFEQHHPTRTAPEITEATEFKAIGLDVIDMVCIALVAEDAFGIALPVEVEACASVGDMAALVAACGGMVA